MNLPIIQPLMPEIIMAVLAMSVLMLELVIHRKETIGLLSIVSVAIVVYYIPQSYGKAFGGMFISDGYSVFFKFIFFINLVLTVLISIKYIEIEEVNQIGRASCRERV